MEPFELAGYRVEPSALRVISPEGDDLRLEHKAMQVLICLAGQAGQVVSRRELEESVWSGRVVTEDAVTNAIAKLRRAFGDEARHPRVIETVPKSGYRLMVSVEPVRETYAEAAAPALAARDVESRRWKLRRGWGVGAAVCLLLLAAWGFLAREETRPGQPGAAPEKPAVAVLPFENLGAAPEQDYFANGVTADLITDLSKVSGLLVIAPGSVFAYKGSDAGPRQISQELDVDYVVAGSVQRSGDRLRVNVQLIEASAERALWGERYAGSMDEVFEIQDKLTVAVISALKIELAPAEQESLYKRPTASVIAYDHYLRGLEDHGRRSKEHNVSAKDHFQRAIELDPRFARAYAGLAMAHSRDAIDGWTATPERSLEIAARLAARAAEMDPGLPQVHFVSGQVNLFRRRHLEAIEAAEQAIQINPNYADAYALNAWILSYAGRPDEALAELEKAMRLNPRPPSSYLEILGEIQFVEGNYDESAATFQRVLTINPDYARARMWIAAALALAGHRDQAEWEATELLVISPDLSLDRLGFAFPFKDRRELDTLLDGLRKSGVPD